MGSGMITMLYSSSRESSSVPSPFLLPSTLNLAFADTDAFFFFFRPRLHLLFSLEPPFTQLESPTSPFLSLRRPPSSQPAVPSTLQQRFRDQPNETFGRQRRPRMLLGRIVSCILERCPRTQGGSNRRTSPSMGEVVAPSLELIRTSPLLALQVLSSGNHPRFQGQDRRSFSSSRRYRSLLWIRSLPTSSVVHEPLRQLLLPTSSLL